MRKVLGWVFLVILIVAAVAGVPRVMAAKTGPGVGLMAPEFSLSDLNGKKVELKKIVAGHKVTLLNFWATWCPPCRAEIPELAEFYKTYAGRGVELLAVNLQQSPNEVREFAKKNGMAFPVLTDTAGSVGSLYQIYAIPTTFIIDRQGKIRAKIEGSTTGQVLREKIEPLLKAK
jgi:DsbE subfamily thiol:disulfide oxidoreductase